MLSPFKNHWRLEIRILLNTESNHKEYWHELTSRMLILIKLLNRQDLNFWHL